MYIHTYTTVTVSAANPFQSWTSRPNVRCRYTHMPGFKTLLTGVYGGTVQRK